MSPESARAFVALELRSETRVRLEELCRALRARVHQVRWVRPETLHLTLRFLGESSMLALARLQPALESAATACPPSAGVVAEVGMFPPRGCPRVVWLGLRLPEPVLALQRAAEAAAIASGFAPERRPFRPHLTLGRFRGRAIRPGLPTPAPFPVPLDNLVLFRSELRPAGAVHTPIASFALGGGVRVQNEV